MPKKIGIIGLGWLGLPLAKELHAQGNEIKGSTTSSEKLMSLLNSNYSIRIIQIQGDKIRGNLVNFLTGLEILILNIPPSKTGNGGGNYAHTIATIAKAAPPNLKVIFISSTSVYGDQDGVVNETSLTVPTKNSGKEVLEGEQVIQQMFGDNATIVRFSGLFGVDRHPGNFIKPSLKLANPNGSINLIHQEDCVSLISKIIEKEIYGEIINGCAPGHPNRKEFYSMAAKSLKKSPPKFNIESKTCITIVDHKKSVNLLGMVYKYNNPIDFFN